MAVAPICAESWSIFPFALDRGGFPRAVIDTRVWPHLFVLAATIPKPYSMDLGEWVVEAVAAVASRRAAAELCGISLYVVILVRRRKATGTIVAKPSGGKCTGAGRSPRVSAGAGCRQPDLTWKRSSLRWPRWGLPAAAPRRDAYTNSTASALERRFLYAGEQKRAEVVRAHRRWIREQSLLGPAQLVIDETCTSTAMAWLRGRSTRGRRLIGDPPHGHRKATTFVAGLRLRNVTAPFVLDGAVNGRMFPAYAEQRLAPTLECRDIAIMDNLRTRKVAGVQEVIEAAGATPCYPPPYSPDLNPIETASSKFEALLRKAAKRTIPCAG
jgi:transposase